MIAIPLLITLWLIGKSKEDREARAHEEIRIRDSIKAEIDATPLTDEDTKPAVAAPVKLDYKVNRVDNRPDEYGPATKLYVTIRDAAQLDQVNAELIQKYRQNKFMQVWYYSDAAMQKRVAVYTYNPSRHFEDLARDE